MSQLSVSAVIPAYTLERWPLIQRAVESVRAQTVPVESVVLCVDHNAELVERARAQWPSTDREAPVRVLANADDAHLTGMDVHKRAHGTARRFGAGSARNTAVATLSSDIVAFLDDDAWAEPNWIEELLAAYTDASVVAVGGAPLPDYETARPAWFPLNFDWVFGCAYRGLPTVTAPLRRLIGANLSVRLDAFRAVGEFQSVDFDDLDLCMRLAARYGPAAVYYAPRAVVHHYVPAERVTWRYFCRRCFYVNREKVEAFRNMGSAASLAAERDFVLNAVARGFITDLKRGLAGETGAFRSIAAMFIGIVLAGLGHLSGRLTHMTRRSSDAPENARAARSARARSG